MIFDQLSRYSISIESSTHGVDLPDPRNLSEVGRCRSAGCQPHGCGCQAYKDVLAASPQSDTAPPSHGVPLLLLLAQWPLQVQGAALPIPLTLAAFSCVPTR